MDVFRQRFIGKWAKINKLRTHVPQGLQAVFIIEAESLVPGHGDAHRGVIPRQLHRLAADRLCILCQCQQCIYINGFFRLRSHNLQLFLQAFYVGGGDQTQMSAFQGTVRHFRQKAQGLDLALKPFSDGFCQSGIRHRAALIEDHAPDTAVRVKAQKPLYACKNGQGRTFGIDYQHHRGTGGFCHLIGTGRSGGQAHAVVEAHNALNNADVTAFAVSRQQVIHGIFPEEKQIQIGAFCADDPAVEHGVDIIRPAFESAYLQFPVNQRLQNSAGHCGLAASAASACQQNAGNTLLHQTSPLFCRVLYATAARWTYIFRTAGSSPRP